MPTPSPALAAAMEAEANLTGAPPGGPGEAQPPAPADPAPDALDPKKLTRELAATIYGTTMLAANKFPSVRATVHQEDAEETAAAIVAALQAWDVLHWLKGGKYMAAIQAGFVTYAYASKVAEAIGADRAKAAEAAGAAGDAAK